MPRRMKNRKVIKVNEILLFLYPTCLNFQRAKLATAIRKLSMADGQENLNCQYLMLVIFSIFTSCYDETRKHQSSIILTFSLRQNCASSLNFFFYRYVSSV